MGEISQRQSHVFIVRIWQESADSPWRGQVEHVHSKQKYYFTTLADLNAFIRLHTIKGPDADPKHKHDSL